MTYLHSPRSLLLSLAVLALFKHTGVSCSSAFLFLLVFFAAAFLGVLLALAGSSSDTSTLPVCFPFFFASPPFLPSPPLDATGLLGGILFLGEGPLACTERTMHYDLVQLKQKWSDPTDIVDIDIGLFWNTRSSLTSLIISFFPDHIGIKTFL